MTQQLAEVLERSANLKKIIQKCNILRLWEEVVSKPVAQKTEAVKVQNKVLYVNTESSVWSQELNFLKPQIIEKINERMGGSALRDIKFSARGVKHG